MDVSVGHRGSSQGYGYVSGTIAAVAANAERRGDTSHCEDDADEAQPSPKDGKSHLVTAWTADRGGINQNGQPRYDGRHPATGELYQSEIVSMRVAGELSADRAGQQHGVVLPSEEMIQAEAFGGDRLQGQPAGRGRY